MYSAFSVDFLVPTSDFQTPITFLLVDKNTKCGHLFSYLDRKENSLMKCAFFASLDEINDIFIKKKKKKKKKKIESSIYL